MKRRLLSVILGVGLLAMSLVALPQRAAADEVSYDDLWGYTKTFAHLQAYQANEDCTALRFQLTAGEDGVVPVRYFVGNLEVRGFDDSWMPASSSGEVVVRAEVRPEHASEYPTTDPSTKVFYLSGFGCGLGDFYHDEVQCSSGQASHSVWLPEGENPGTPKRYNWTLQKRGSSQVILSGQARYAGGSNAVQKPVVLPRPSELSPGIYRLTFTSPDVDYRYPSLADFKVNDCATAQIQCDRATITNPVNAADGFLGYTTGELRDYPDDDGGAVHVWNQLALASGATVSVPIGWDPDGRFQWGTHTNDSDVITPIQTVTVPSACQLDLTAAPTPRVTGTPKVGYGLTAAPGAWAPAPVNLKYQWLRNGRVIPGATSTRYTLTAVDRGQRIALTVTGSKMGYKTAAKTSAATPVVAYGTLIPATPKITGTAKKGKILKVVPGTWKPAGVKLSYQWKRDGKSISGATKATYKLTAKDKKKRITITVTGSKDGYATTARTSASTGKVK